MEEAERQQYLVYVKACREGNQALREEMYRNGFRPDRQRLMYFASKSAELYNLIFNESFVVKLDSGHVVGHVYIDYPVYDPSDSGTRKVRKQMGFYPKDGGLRAIHGPGVIKDEVQESGRVLENHPTAKAVLRVPQEVSLQIEHWRAQQPNAKLTYSLLNKNCIAFVNEVLQQSGFVDGLTDKFNEDDISKLNFKAVKLGVKFYFRIDNEAFLKVQEKVDEKVGLSGIKIRNFQMHYQYYQKEKADRVSFENQLNLFFNCYHDPEFYATFFKGKQLTEGDYVWALSNHLSGSQVMMINYSPLRDRFLQLCRPKELRHPVCGRASNEDSFLELREGAIIALEDRLVSCGVKELKPAFSVEHSVAFKERENQNRQNNQKRRKVIALLQARIAVVEQGKDHSNDQKYSLERVMRGCEKPRDSAKQANPRDPKLPTIQSMNFKLAFNGANDFLRNNLSIGGGVKVYDLKHDHELKRRHELKQRADINAGTKRQVIMNNLKQHAEKFRVGVSDVSRPQDFSLSIASAGSSVSTAVLGNGNCKKIVVKPARPNKKQ